MGGPRETEATNTTSLGRPGPSGEGQEAILDAAAQAFMVSGYNGTSIDDIADLLGSTKGRIYHYFRGKAEIYLAIHYTMISRMLDEVAEIASQPGRPTERLYAMAERHAILLQDRPAFARVAMVHTEGYAASSERLRDQQNDVLRLRARYEQCFRNVIMEGIDAGEFRYMHPSIATKPVLGALNWLVMWYRSDKPMVSEVAIAAELANFVVQGLRKCTTEYERPGVTVAEAVATNPRCD